MGSMSEESYEPTPTRPGVSPSKLAHEECKVSRVIAIRSVGESMINDSVSSIRLQ